MEKAKKILEVLGLSPNRGKEIHFRQKHYKHYLELVDSVIKGTYKDPAVVAQEIQKEKVAAYIARQKELAAAVKEDKPDSNFMKKIKEVKIVRAKAKKKK